ncbi:MAG: adenylate/guanylate cyclase domain-containing protein [Candidatus Sumerlaeia bacterium]|nr:adenylate/guanylate cyclase domain-containing protein [Candidatus Sumerlaeia bacterium]
MSREMRVATAVFADVSGFSAMSREYHPEVMERLINEFSAIAMEEALAHNGFVVDFAGDGVFMVFGAPYSFGNDAESAVAAATGFVTRLAEVRRPDGKALSARAGVATGELLSTVKEAGAHRQFAVIGPTVNLAARLEQNSVPGQVLVCQTTGRLVAHRWDIAETQPLVLKNISDGYVAHRVGAERTSDSLGGRPPLPFIGRDRELARLLEWFDAPGPGAVGKVALVSGEAGIGKSRLLEQLGYRIEDRAKLVSLRGTPEGEHFMLAPFVAWLRAEVGSGGEGSAGVRAFFAARPGLDPEDAPIIGYLLGESWAVRALEAVESADLRASVFRVLAEALGHGAAGRSVLLVVDDFQWIDALSARFLEEFAAGGGGRALLLAGRDGEVPEGKLRECTSLVMRLRGLAPEDSLRLARRITEGLGLPDEKIEELASRASGNPLYQAELVALERDGGDDSASGSVPATLRGVIQWRIDRLSARMRQTLQAGAVLGYEFSRGLLASLEQVRGELERSLAGLQAKEFLAANGRGGDEVLLRFIQSITRDVAYEMLLPAQQRLLHEEAARRLEETFPEPSGDVCAAIARHRELAGQTAAAIPWLLRVADHRERLGAFKEAVESLRRLLALAEKESVGGLPPAARARALGRLGYLLQSLGEHLEGESVLRQSLADARALSNGMLECEASLWLGAALLRQSRHEDAEPHLEAAFAHSRSNAIDRLLAPSLIARGELARARERNDEALRDFAEGSEVARRSGQPSAEADALNNEAMVRWHRGEVAAAHDLLTGAAPIYRQCRRLPMLAATLINLGILRERLGRYGAAADAFSQGRELSQRLGQTLHAAIASLNESNLLLHLERGSEALERAAEAADSARRIGSAQVEGYALNNLARALLAVGRPGEALAPARRARVLLRRVNRAGKEPLIPALTAAEARAHPLASASARDLERAHRIVAAIRDRAAGMDGAVELRIRAMLVDAAILWGGPAPEGRQQAAAAAQAAAAQAEALGIAQYSEAARRLLHKFQKG